MERLSSALPASKQPVKTVLNQVAFFNYGLQKTQKEKKPGRGQDAWCPFEEQGNVALVRAHRC